MVEVSIGYQIVNIESGESGAILIVAFSRPQELRKCLNSIRNQSINGLPVVVLHQTGNTEVSQVIEENLDLISNLFQFNNIGYSPLQNINLNRILGYKICFEIMLFDWVIAIEDDIELASDAVEFVIQMHERYKNKKMYRGINLGSLENSKNAKINTYSRLSYGLHGQASAIPERTWAKFNSRRAVSSSITEPLDSLMENFLKRGYMITPNRSRFKDNGWNGTHAPKDPKDKYFSSIEKSWTGYNTKRVTFYVQSDQNHSWRRDARVFSWSTPFLIYVSYLRRIFLVKVKKYFKSGK
jgi:hypothetical protein